MKESKVRVKIENWTELALYIALTHKQEEIDRAGLGEMIHTRKFETGPRPVITTARAFSLPPENGEEEKWNQPKRFPNTNAEKKKLIATAIITAVEAVMSNHVYSFSNIWRRQRDGGAIGNVLTGEMAKVVMTWWTTRFNELSAAVAPQPIPVEDSDSLYVNDYNFLYYILEPGTRWIDEGETMKVVEDLVELSAAAAPQPIPVEDSDSLYVDDYNFLYYILEPGTRWIDEGETMKVVEDLVELSAAAAPQPIPVEDSDSLYVDDYNFLYYILEPGTRWIDEGETMKVVEDLVELSAAAAPQPIPVEDSDSLCVDDYNFLYYILEPGTRWIDEGETMKVVEDLVELSAAAAPQPIPVEDSDSLCVDDYNFLYYILEPGTRWIDEGETMKVVEDLVELSAAAAPQPIPVEDSDSLCVDDYNFLYYILEPGTRWIDEGETMKVVENLVDRDKEIPEDVRSMDETVKKTNSICPVLQLIGDCPGANTDGKFTDPGHLLLDQEQPSDLRTLQQTNSIQPTNNAEECKARPCQ